MWRGPQPQKPPDRASQLTLHPNAVNLTIPLILMDPCFQPTVTDSNGNDISAPFQIQLAHEFGHAYADETNGPGQFGDDDSEDYVVSHYENPVRAEYGLPERNVGPQVIIVQGGKR